MGINSPFFKKHKTKKLNVLQEKKKGSVHTYFTFKCYVFNM